MTVEGDFPPDRQIFVGVSSCLLGEKVRYDGSDRQMPWLKGEFPQGFTPVPVCPEVEVGMGVPRETVALRQGSSKVRMIASKSGIDHTQAMESWAHQRTRELSTEPLSGFILKSRSPSCGVENVPIEGGEPGSGLFARALREFDRWLPRVTEETLGDRQERSAFFTSIEVYQRLSPLRQVAVSVDRLATIHRREKLLLLSLSREATAKLDLVLADSARFNEENRGEAYLGAYLEAIALGSSRRDHRSALESAQHQLDPALDGQERKNLASLIESSLAGDTPVVVALAAIRHHARGSGLDPLGVETYLSSSTMALEGE